MYLLKYSSRFKKDLKHYRHNKVVLGALTEFLDLLIVRKKLPAKFCNHKLREEFKDCYECHIGPDVLPIYKIDKAEIIVLLLRIGTHSELF